MKDPVRRTGVVAATFLVWLSAFSLAAHTLPISYLHATQDASYVHVELTINPFELNFFPQLDANKDGMLDSAEIAASDPVISGRVMERIALTVDGKRVLPESAGLASEATDHHLTLRAHFPVAAAAGAIALDTDLPAVTSMSHLTEVTFKNERGLQLARLDAQQRSATFKLAATESTITEAVPVVPAQASDAFIVVLGLAFIPLIGVFVVLLMFAPKHLREDPAHY